ncbi:MAG: hypothetical protein WCP15_00305 [bacterium]
MFKFCQSEYKKVFKYLSSAKKTGRSKDIKKSLLMLTDALRRLSVQSKENNLIFSDFIYDPKMFFKVIDKRLSFIGADIEIHTNGLIAQMLEMIGVVDYQKIADRLGQSILNLHSQLSRGNKEPTKEYEELKEAIDIIRLITK